MSCKKKLAIFDLDGTLYCTKNVNYNAYKFALEKYGVSLDYDYFCSFCNGKKYTQFLPSICNFDMKTLDLIHQLKKSSYSNYLSYAIQNDELFDIIEGLKKTYYIALVTTASRQNAIELLEEFNKTKCFDLILTQNEIQHPKPDPEGFIKAQLHFGISAEDTIIFEDSEIGVEAAMKCTNKIFVIKGYN